LALGNFRSKDIHFQTGTQKHTCTDIMIVCCDDVVHCLVYGWIFMCCFPVDSKYVCRAICQTRRNNGLDRLTLVIADWILCGE
jgi:hypothetical protein